MAKIMLVEDDNNLREIYGARLLAEGYEIVSAKDGEEALALAVKEKPDLIISDIMMPKISGFDMLDILRMPGVMMSVAIDTDALEADFKQVLNQVLQHLIDARAREGEKLKAVILDRLQQIEQHVTKVKPMMPNLVAQYQAKLSAKLHEATSSHDDDRIRQEMVLYAQRIDVDEELSRLDSHISEVKRILQAGGAVGKRLDFLMQEMNREANTLGSKSVAVETSQTSMELKVLIEQMREQIQNIE